MKTCTLCRCTKLLDDFYNDRSNKDGKSTGCKQCNKAQFIARRNKLKEAAYHAYGGYICKCCGEQERHFLCIDHIKNNGSQHRKVIGKDGLYRWLFANNYPAGFQVLCMNCNFGKYRNNGICPHKIGTNIHA